MICKKCSNQLNDNATVCSRCGSKVKKGAPLNKGMLITIIVLSVALIATAAAFAIYYINNDGGSASVNVVDNSVDKIRMKL